MRPYDILFLIAGACISQPLAAQVAVTLTALTPITTTATEGLVTATNTQPAGPLANAYMEVSSTIPGTGTTAMFESSAEVTTIEAYCSIGAGCSNNTASAVTSCNTVEVLANFTAAVPTRVRLAVEFDSALSPGATVPLAAVDVDNNGSLDYVNGTQTGFFQPRIIGPLGWQFRVILDADLWQPGQNLTNVRIILLPDNDVLVDDAVVGCGGPGPFVRPSFLDRGVTVQNLSGAVVPRVYVFGLQTQPVLLPTITTFPCLLLPRPDVVLVTGSYSSLEIPLPANVRPVTIWIQGVELQAGLLYTTSGVRVLAN